MHYYQFNIGDYAAHTRHLSPMEDLAYRRLLDLYYSSEKPIIKDIKKLSRLLSLHDFEEDIIQVLEDFFECTDEGYVQNRVVEEITKYHAKSDAARANGRKGGRPKKADANPDETKGKAKKTQLVNLANPEETGLKANQEPITNNQETLNNNYNAPKNSSLCGIQFETKDGQWSCPDDYYQVCVDTYGKANVDSEFGKANFWLTSNPSKRKTPRGMKKFLGSWLQRRAEQDAGFKAPEKPKMVEEKFYHGELPEGRKELNESMRSDIQRLMGEIDA